VVRTFVAVPVEEPVTLRRLAGARSLLPDVHGVRWIPPGQLHLTLKFLGEIEADRVDAAKAATARAARPAEGGPSGAGPFRLALEGLGAFPPHGPARVLWAGCAEGSGALSLLASAVEAAFVAEGFPPEERPFSPHLTLARVKDPDVGRRLSRALASLPREPFGALGVGALVLYRSELSRSGAEHVELLRVALESAAAPQ